MAHRAAMHSDPIAERLQTVALGPEFRQIVDTLPAFVWCATPDGSIAFLNRRGLEYTGLSLQQITGWSWRDTNILHPEDTELLFDAWQAIVASGREGEIQARMRRGDGQYRWFLFRVAPLYDEAGALAAWWGIDVEIDARKRAEDQLRQALVEAQAIIEDRTRAETLLTGEKRLLEMIARGDALPLVLEAVCGVVEAAAPPCRCSILLVDQTRTRLQLGAAPSLPGSYNDAIHGRMMDPRAGPCGMAAFVNDQVIVEDTAHDTRWDAHDWRTLAIAHGLRACWSTPIASSDGAVLGTFALYWPEPGRPGQQQQNLIERMTYLAAVAIDRKRSEDTLSAVRSDLAHVARAATLGELTASIAHEINQPLSAIVNNANAGLRWLSADKFEEARTSMALVVTDGHRASEILDRIRAMVRRSPVQKEPVDLNDALREVLTLVASQADNHGVALESRLAHIPRVRADRVQIQQVVLNLFMNAMEAMTGTPAGLRRITVSSIRADEQTVHISVSDAGAGINPEQLERLFEPFYSTKPDGLGMGLPISRGIIRAHDGHLWATANADRGATFAFSLPASAGDRA